MARVAIAGRVSASDRAASSGRVALPASNLLAWSEDLTHAPPWSLFVIEAPLAAADPIGGNSAQLLFASSTSGTHQYLSSTVTPAADAGRLFTRSAYFKAAPGQTNWIWLGVNNGVSGVYFDPVSGATGTIPTGTTVRVLNIGAGWWRVAVTYAAVFNTSERFIIASAGNGSALTGWAGAGQGVITWGQQLVRANWPGIYTPTTSTAVTTPIRNVP